MNQDSGQDKKIYFLKLALKLFFFFKSDFRRIEVGETEQNICPGSLN